MTGLIIEGLEDAVKAAERISTLSWKRCRALFEQRFGASRMAEDDLAIYQRLIDGKPQLPHAL